MEGLAPIILIVLVTAAILATSTKALPVEQSSSLNAAAKISPSSHSATSKSSTIENLRDSDETVPAKTSDSTLKSETTKVDSSEPLIHDRMKGYPRGPCIPGDEKKYFCNTCTCSDSGKDYVCTRATCPPVDDGKCVPGTRWMDDCNHCGCSETGIPYCTMMGCMSMSIPHTMVHVPK